MAIIKCPECGHEVSDKASVCPNCGVAIAGTVTGGKAPAPKKNKRTGIIVAVVIVVVICVIGVFLYSGAKGDKEKDAYEYALSSSDPMVLQSYLDKYDDAPEAHRDSIMAHLSLIKQGDADWTNAVISGSRSVIEDYLERNPNSIHKNEAIHKMDSIDWAQASYAKTLDAYNLYLSNNPNGEHVDDANDAINTLKTNTVLPEEKAEISAIFRQFFQSINSRDADGLTSTVSSFLTSFLGKTDATKNDVVTFMDKIYKDDITNMNWHVNNDYKIDKKEIGDNEYEYTVQFSATEQIERTDPTKEKNAKYQIKAKVDPTGKITEFNMVKILN